MSIKPVTKADIGSLLDIAEQVYPSFDRGAAAVWAASVIGNPDIAFLKLGQSAVIASITQAFWGGPRRCYLLFAFGRGPKRIWEVLKLMRAVDAWRRQRGAEAFLFGEDTGIDFGPLAKRLGAKLDRPSWTLEGGHQVLEEPRPWSSTLSLALAGGRRGVLQQALGS